VRTGDEIAGRYRLEEPAGRGPLSEVWRAHDSTLDRTVALKLLSPTANLDRFRREAKAAATLAHENVMRVYDYGEDSAGPFIALEWLPGGTLEDRLRGEPLPFEETRRVAQGVASGLAHLHARGLVHRDLKPANVLFDEEDRPKLADFGLARGAAGSGTLTEAGTVLGTASYISPEQAAGEPAGPASDVYSFGVVLFRMLTGALPFAADDALALVNMHRFATPPAVESLRPDAPHDLARLTAVALHKDPTERPADGAALLAALGTTQATVVLGSETEATRVLAAAPVTPPVPAPVPPAAGGLDRRWLIAALVVLLAAAGGLLAWAVTRPGTATPAEVSTRATHTHQPPPTTAQPPTTTRPPTTTAATRTQPTTTAPPTTSPTTSVTITTTTTTIPTTTTAPTAPTQTATTTPTETP
jgi:eukaryotic-like serine/threonine-protein kinase